MKKRLCFGVKKNGEKCDLFGILQEVQKSTKNCPRCGASLYFLPPENVTKKKRKEAMGKLPKTNKNTWQNRRVKEGGCKQSYVNGRR